MPTGIQWTDETWSPVTGCTRVSPGCANCYIERTPPFRMAGRRFATIDGTSTTGVQLHPDRLDQPLHWRKPRRVFVCSIADLFHDDVGSMYHVEVWARMALAPAHAFQVLTKRPERALAILGRDGFHEEVQRRVEELAFDGASAVPRDVRQRIQARARAWLRLTPWPLQNVWVGVSIENARYTWRADVLRQIPAAVRFISAEPLLGSLFPHDPNQGRTDDSTHPMGETGAPAFSVRAATARQVARGDGEASPASEHDPVSKVGRRSRSSAPLDLTGIDWAIIGGESGPGARPFHLEHAREIIAAARSRDPEPSVFVKQLGARPLALFDDLGIGVLTERPLKLRDPKGGDPDEWPADLRVREFPRSAA